MHRLATHRYDISQGGLSQYFSSGLMSHNIIPWFTVYVIKRYDAQQLYVQYIKDFTLLILHGVGIYV